MVSLLRIIFVGILAFLALKIFAGVFKSTNSAQVKGKARTKPIDLSKEDVEDIDFEETRDKNNK